MPRPRTFNSEDLKGKALHQFWKAGYTATSIDDLVEATGVSRYGIYSEFGDKHGLYLACFEAYIQSVVSPAFSQVEAPGAALPAIRAYFEHQIAAAQSAGLPGPGCFIGNAATETAPHDEEARAFVDAHHARLRAGFAQAIRNRGHIEEAQTARLAHALTVFATGLWSLSRTETDADHLRSTTTTFLDLLESALPQRAHISRRPN